MKRKVSILSTMLLILSLLLVACSANNTPTTNTNAADNESVAENTTTAEDTAEKKSVKIGILQFMDHVSLDSARQGFEDEMKTSGYEVEYTYENSNGDISLTTTIPQKFVSEKVDLVYAIATPASQGASNVISDIPIVFSAVTDPVGAGLVESIEAPGGNTTGVSDYMDPGIQIDSFLKIFPDVKTFGVIYNTGEQNSLVQVEELEAALTERGLKLEKVGVSTVNDIPQAIASLSTKIDALFALTDNTVASAAPIVTENLGNYNIPSLSAEEGQVTNGLLMSEGVDYYEQGKQAARMAIKILDGAEPATLPVEMNEVNIKKINKSTAESLGLDLTSNEFEGMEVVED